jgi:hypothetical protein
MIQRAVMRIISHQIRGTLHTETASYYS